MATNSELRREQTEKLFDLLKLEAENKQRGIEVYGLNDLILRTIASMQQEDVAWVEKVLSGQR
jgi:hypothetical protein